MRVTPRVTSRVTSPVVSRVTDTRARRGGEPSFDADALDYFSRAEALGGSFDQTAINAAYTESYLKNAINSFVVGCKTDGVWALLHEFYLHSFVSFAGLPAKLKFLSNNASTLINFVSGDYLSVGANAGLTAGATKLVNTNGVQPASPLTATIGVYLQTNSSLSNGRIMGAHDATSQQLRFNMGVSEMVRFMAMSSAGQPSSSGVGHFTGVVSSSYQGIYKNGVEQETRTPPASIVMPTVTYHIAQVNGLTGSFTDRISLAYFGVGMTAAQVSSLHSRINTLMTAIGANK